MLTEKVLLQPSEITPQKAAQFEPFLIAERTYNTFVGPVHGPWIQSLALDEFAHVPSLAGRKEKDLLSVQHLWIALNHTNLMSKLLILRVQKATFYR